MLSTNTQCRLIFKNIGNIEKLVTLTRDLTIEQTVAQLATKGVAQAEIEATLTKKGYTQAAIQEVLADRTSSNAKLTLVDRIKQMIAYQKALASLNGQEISTWVALKAAILSAGKALLSFLLTNPVGWAVLAVGAIASVVGVIDLVTTSTEEAREELNELTSELNDLQSEIDSLNSELKTTGQRIDEILQKDQITLVEQEELEKLQAQNDELERELRIKESLERIKKTETTKAATKVFNSVPDNGFWEARGTREYHVDKTGTGITYYHNVDRNRLDASLDYINQIREINKEIEKIEKEQSYYMIGSNKYEALENRIKVQEELKSQIQSTLGEYVEQFGDEDDNMLRGVSKETDAILDQLDEIYTKYDELMNYSETIEVDINQRLRDKFTHGSKLSDVNFMSNADREINNWLNSLSDEDKTIMLSCDLKDASLTELKNYLELQKKEIEQDPITFSDIFALENEKGELNTLGKLNEELDKIQSANSGLKEAMDTYNTAGKFTIDQLQDIVSYGDEYLKYLIDENGALELNEKALQDVAKAQVQKMKAEALSNLINTITGIEDQAHAEQFLAEQLINTADAYQEVSKASLVAWYNQQLMLGEIDKATLDKVASQADTMWKGINEIFDSVDFSFGDKVADDVDLLEKEITYLEAQFNAGMISYNDYLSQRKALLDDYYNQGKIKADEYYKYIVELHEDELSIYDKAINAVNRKIDDQIDLLEKQKESLEESYQLKIDSIQSEIDKLTEANKEREDQIALEKALYELEKAKRNRDKKLYNGEQFIYTSDPETIRDAQEEVYDIEFEKNIQRLEKEIEALEKELDDASKAIDDQIDDLQKYADEWKKIADVYEDTQEDMIAAQIWGVNWEKDLFDNRLDNLNDFKDKYIAAQEAMTKASLDLAKAQAQTGFGGNGSGNGNDNSAPKPDDSNSETIKELAIKQQISDYELKVNKLITEYREASSQRAGVSTLQTINGKIVQTQEAIKRKQKELEELQKNKYHTGLDKGYVGSDKFSDDKRLNILQVIGKGLRSNEVPAILEKKELVLTEEQQKNIVAALLNRPVDTSNFKQKNFLPQIDSTRNTSSGFSFSIGEIHLHEVKDVDGLSKAIITQLPNKVLQNCFKR